MMMKPLAPTCEIVYLRPQRLQVVRPVDHGAAGVLTDLERVLHWVIVGVNPGVVVARGVDSAVGVGAADAVYAQGWQRVLDGARLCEGLAREVKGLGGAAQQQAGGQVEGAEDL